MHVHNGTQLIPSHLQDKDLNFNRVQRNCSEQAGRTGNGERCRLNSVTTPATLTAVRK